MADGCTFRKRNSVQSSIEYIDTVREYLFPLSYRLYLQRICGVFSSEIVLRTMKRSKFSILLLHLTHVQPKWLSKILQQNGSLLLNKGMDLEMVVMSSTLKHKLKFFLN